MKVISTLGLCLILISLQAQKVDLDKFFFTASYRELPRKVIDTSFHTFSAQLEYGPLTRIALAASKEDFQEQVQVQGWKKLPYQAHLQVLLNFNDIMIENSEVKEKIDIIKDKTGKETSRKTTYVVQVGYTFSPDARLTDFKGRRIETIDLSKREQKRVFVSEPFPSPAEANAWFKFGLISLMSQLTHKSISNTIDQLDGLLSSNYGYSERTASDLFWILDSKKHPEYDAHRRACMAAKQVLSQMSIDEPLAETRIQLQPAIDYFTGIKKRYATDSKSDKKLRYSCYFNLAKIYYYIDKPEASIQYATELKLNGYDTRDGNALEAIASDLKSQLRLNKINSRHFPFIVQDFEGPNLTGSTQQKYILER